MHRRSLDSDVSLPFVDHKTPTSIVQDAVILAHELISQNHVYFKQQIHDKTLGQACEMLPMRT